MAVLFVVMTVLPGGLSAAALKSQTPLSGGVQNAAGSFALFAMHDEKILIEPSLVFYQEGWTIKEALVNSDHDFGSLAAQGFISVVDGVDDLFVLFYDDGGYDLNDPAENITALCISTVSDWYSAEVVALVDCMATYNAMANHVQNYPNAITAYDNALDDLMGGLSGSAAKNLRLALENAIAEYENLMNGTRVSVTFSVTQGEDTVSSAHIRMVDIYGNVFTQTGTSISVVPGEYSYAVSDGGYNRTEGTVSVSTAGASVSLALPSGKWIQSVDIGKVSGQAESYDKEMTDDMAATYYLPDTVGPTGASYLYAVQGADMPVGTALRTLFIGINGTDYSNTSRSWASRFTALVQAVTQGMIGNSFEVVAKYTTSEGQVMIQAYQMTIVRTPTLSGMVAKGDGTQLPLSFQPTTFSYHVNTVSDAFTVLPTAYGLYEDGYSVSVNGNAVAEGGEISIPLTEDIWENDGTYTIVTTVAHDNGEATDYVTHVTKLNSVTVSLVLPEETTVSLYNEAGAEIMPSDGSSYRLIPGETYTYIGTRQEYYHSTATFIATEALSVLVAAPINEDWLTDLVSAAGTSAANKTNAVYPADASFAPNIHEYTYSVSDNNSSFGVWANTVSSAGTLTMASAYVQRSNATNRNITIRTANTTGANMTGFVEVSGLGNTMVIKVAKAKDAAGVTLYQEYILHAQRTLHVTSMSVKVDGESALLKKTETMETGFDRDILAYTIEIPRASTSLALTWRFPNTSTGTTRGGYTAVISCGTQEQTISYEHNIDLAATVQLDPWEESEEVTLTILHDDPGALAQTYVLTIQKLPPVPVSIDADPADTVVFITESLSGKRAYPDENGVFMLLTDYTYNYVATCNGYIGVQGSFVADTEKTVSITLVEAPINDKIDPTIPSSWANFRGNEENNSVVDTATPIVDEDTVMYWAEKLGEGYSAGAVGSPVLVDGFLYTYAGNKVMKVNTLTGAIEATGTMDHSSSFSITPPTYAEGILFVALSNGSVQAFNAKDLTSLWIYKDALSGQPNSPIMYHDGYIYTGFWNSETRDANYVALSITDEEPENTLETKLPTWTYTYTGGFYWAGAYVCGQYLLVGTDDGESGYTTGHAKLLSLHPKTGILIDAIEMPGVGDLRSTISYDSETDAYYFTTKGGDFYQVKMDVDGKIRGGSLRGLRLNNGSTNPQTPPMSTSTPTVYNGRAYIGVSGVGQFGAYSGHNITVVDLAAWKIAYSVPTQGYPQTSGLLTTAYEEAEGAVYVYFLDNFKPGKLRVLRDKPGQVAPDYLTTEAYSENGQSKSAETPYVLFTPSGAQEEYALCSPIVDEYGVLYFKNDSAHMMAVGHAVESLTVTTLPDKMKYEVGEIFDKTGMVVTLTYANGKMRDVTPYVSFSEDPLTEEDTDFQIRFPYVMYQNRDGAVGVDYAAPSTSLSLVFGAGLPGDVNGDEVVNTLDVLLILQYLSDSVTFSAEQVALADYNGDGSITTQDAFAILQYLSA